MEKMTHSGADSNTLKIQQEGAIGMQVTGGGVWVLTPEATMDDPTEADAVWIAVKVWDVTAGAFVATFSAAGAAYADLPGFGGFRLRQTSGAGTPTSLIGETLEN